MLAFGRAIFSEKTAGLKAPRIGRRRLRRMRAMDGGAGLQRTSAGFFAVPVSWFKPRRCTGPRLDRPSCEV